MQLKSKLLALMLCLACTCSTVSSQSKGFLFENGNYSYKIVLSSEDSRSWFEAEEICREREGGHLASITSKAQHTFLQEKIKMVTDSNDEPEELWLGAIDEQIVDVYQWIDGETFEYSSAFWAPGEPNNRFNEDYEVCVAMKSTWGRGEWVDDDCYTNKGYICKIQGIPKRLVEQKRFGYEFDHGNYIYKFIFMQRDMLTWTEAEIYCRDVEKAHLASVRSLKESKTIESRLRMLRYHFGFSKMWIGASDLKSEGEFEWSDGKPFTFQRWIQGEPSGRHGAMEQDCAVVTADPHWGRWRDENCLHHLPFICKINVCHKRSDIAFAVDISTSIRINGFRKSKKFIKEVLANFALSESGVHVGLILFSSQARLIFSFNEHYTHSDVEEAIDKTKYTRGGTRTDRALKLARTELFAFPPAGSSRENIPRFLILTTDGISRHKSITSQEARALKSQGVHVLVVAVGNRVNPRELMDIATRPTDIIRARSFANLEKIVKETSKKICDY